MSILILTHAEIHRLLTVGECIGVMERALAALARGEAYQPLRTIIRPPDADSVMGLMPSHVAGDRPAYGLKVVCVFPHNVRLGKDSHQGGVLLFDGRTGELLIGAGAGRSSAEEITLFKSLGLAIEDLAAAQYLYDKARATKAGTWAEF